MSESLLIFSGKASNAPFSICFLVFILHLVDSNKLESAHFKFIALFFVCGFWYNPCFECYTCFSFFSHTMEKVCGQKSDTRSVDRSRPKLAI